MSLASIDSPSTSGTDRFQGSVTSEVTEHLSRQSLFSDWDLQDYEYPVPLIVRNTFIEPQITRPVSLDEFFEERKIVSCPVSPRSKLDDASLDVNLPMASFLGLRAEGTKIAASVVASFSPIPSETASTDVTLACVEEAIAVDASLRGTCALQLTDSLSNDLPSRGSVGHSHGRCKPCAFFHKQSCQSGAECSFCHLCGPDAKKMKQKRKQAFVARKSVMKALGRVANDFHFRF